VKRPLRALALVPLIALTALARGAPAVAQEGAAALQRQVTEAERAFARTMADRNPEAFAGFVSDEAVFFGQQILRGRTQVTDGWRRFFEGAQAPFSWEPDHVEVLASGTLALSTGPVYDATGKRTGTFNSIWRLEGDGRWRVVFDKGCSCGG
jgi:ketosteroid isomerase-like protein